MKRIWKSIVAIIKRRPIITLVSLSIIAAVAVGATGMVGSLQARNCTGGAIMKCGAFSAGEFKKKYNANATKDLPAIYNHYGVKVKDLETARAGTVTKNGTVYVGGKKVATGGKTVGRWTSPTTKSVKINGKVYYEENFMLENSNPAFVVFDQYGRFKYAVLKDCGNPVVATPTQPKPSLTCDSLKATSVNRTTYRFTATATAKNGAKVTGYTFNFGDGTTKKQTGKTITHTYTKSGTYTASVTVHSNMGNVTNAKCKVKVTVKEEEKPSVDIDKKVNDKEHDTVEVGESFVYQIAVTNTGTVDLKNVAVTDDAPGRTMGAQVGDKLLPEFRRVSAIMLCSTT